MNVEPARVGANQIHIYFFDAKTGAPFARVKELKVTATLPEKGIGRCRSKPQLSGPGHYTIPGALLSASGEWQVELTVRVSAFDEYSDQVGVPIG